MTRGIAAVVVAVAVTAISAGAASAGRADVVRESGAQLTIPSGWDAIESAQSAGDTGPRTLLVVGTGGARAVESECLVAAYHVPSDGAVVVVVGWETSVGASGLLSLASLKLRRATFACFQGRGAAAQVTAAGRDFQVNVMVGDRAGHRTVGQALAIARSFVAH